MWTKTSDEPSSGEIKPNPLFGLKNFTVPVAISTPPMSRRELNAGRSPCTAVIDVEGKIVGGATRRNKVRLARSTERSKRDGLRPQWLSAETANRLAAPE